MNVTPALLSTAILTKLQRRLEAVGGRPWMEILLTSYCDWTEYTLYLLAAERAGELERYHLWGHDPEAPARLQADPGVSLRDVRRGVAAGTSKACSPPMSLVSSPWSRATPA